MSNINLNDEEQGIMELLKEFPKEKQMKILQDSVNVDGDVNDRRVLNSLLLKLRGA